MPFRALAFSAFRTNNAKSPHLLYFYQIYFHNLIFENSCNQSIGKILFSRGQIEMLDLKDQIYQSLRQYLYVVTIIITN